MEIKRAVEFDDNIREKISEIFVDAFRKDLIFFSKDSIKLMKAFSHMFVLEYFYVAVIDNQIAGITACVEKGHFCIKHSNKILIQHLGIIKGFIANIMFKIYFNSYPKYPLEIDSETAIVEFVATSKNFRKKGVASAIMNHLFALPKYKHYVLEVADTNLNAFELYKKLGYNEISRKEMKIGKKYSGINYLIYMKYSKK
jgi:ribosomal protein S18 acetylase RimI-like enzyme